MSSVASPPPAKAKLELNLVRTKKKNHNIKGVRDASRQVSTFFATLGSQVESLIDASPFGVEDPEPWTPETNPTFAVLCDPLSALNEIRVGLPGAGVDGARQIFDTKRDGDGLIATWSLASQTMLMNLRKGLENAVEAEKKLDFDVMVDVADDDRSGADAFVDLGADKWGNSTRLSYPWNESVAEAKVIKKNVKTAVSNFTLNKFLPFVDNLTLRANGIIVTSDDCSVECSIASLVDTISEGECPSLITELEDLTGECGDDDVDTAKTVPEVDQVEITSLEGIKIEIDHSKSEGVEDSDSIEDEDFVMAKDEMGSCDEEDFVDVLEDFDVTSVN